MVRRTDRPLQVVRVAFEMTRLSSQHLIDAYASHLRFLSASWNLNKVLGFRMTASLGNRLAGTNSDPSAKTKRSNEFRFGARRRARLLMTNWCFSNKDSATTTRTPPGRRSLAMVASRWTASIGIKLKEMWTRSSSDYVDNNGASTGYAVYVLENGDKFFAKQTTLGQADAAGKRTSITTGVITGGTGKLAGIQGMVRASGKADIKAGINETQAEIEYWFAK